MKQVTFIHAADLHIDSPMVGLKYLPENIFSRIQESTFKALSNIVDAAIKHKVDFVIIAGDLFDGADRSLRAQVRFRNEMKRLCEHGVQAFVIYGNHDHLGGASNKMGYPENVYIFGESVEHKCFKKADGTTVYLYGFSYPERHVFDSKVDEYTKVQGADFHIGILHGHCEGSSEHGRYAPFKVIELLDKGFDYWALGHIHKKDLLSIEPPIVYPGNPQGRNRKETEEKGCYLVRLSEANAEMQFLETADVIWKEIILDGSKLTGAGDLHQLCRISLDENRLEGKGVLLSITIESIPADMPELMKSIISGDLLEILQEEEGYENSFVWPFSLRGLETGNALSNKEFAEKGGFFADLKVTSENYDSFDDAVSLLYNHPGARKFIDLVSEEEKKSLILESEAILFGLLSNNK